MGLQADLLKVLQTLLLLLAVLLGLQMLSTLKLAQLCVFRLFMLWTESMDFFFSFRYDFTKSKT